MRLRRPHCVAGGADAIFPAHNGFQAAVAAAAVQVFTFRAFRRTMLTRKWPVFAMTMALIVAADLYTKAMAVRHLQSGRTLRVLGGSLPLTLTYNQGAVFSLNVGPASRWFFLITSVIALAAMLVFYHRTDPRHRLQLAALALISSGAVGNLIDRVRWAHGVVDFIGPINLGVMFWPVFNVADSAITCGALLLAAALWRADRGPAPVTASASAPSQTTA